MAQQGVSTALAVEFGGSPLPAKFVNTLVEGYVDHSRTLPDLFLLRFRDPDRVLLEQAGLKIGTEARLLARAGGSTAPVPLLEGVVTALEVELDETGTFTVVRGFDESHRLFRGRRVASYQNMTLADICGQVAQRAGLKPGPVDIAGPVLEHIAQPNVTDWEFVRGLAEEAGAQVYVRDGQLHITRPSEAGGAPDASARAERDPLVLELGANLLRCRAGVSAAEQVSEVEVRGWDVQAKQALVGRAPAGASSTLELGVTAAEVSAPFGEARFVVTDAAYGAQAQVDQAAKALAERIAGSFAELEAVIRGNPEVRAGSAVALNAVGAPFEGRYTVTTSRHVFDAVRGYETWITVSGQQERSLYGLTDSGPADGGSRCAGLVSGTVTDTQDPEGSGRVKVRFPWLSDEYASDWARTAQSGGTGAARRSSPRWATRCWSASSTGIWTGRTCWPGSTTGRTGRAAADRPVAARPGRRGRVALSRAAVPRVALSRAVLSPGALSRAALPRVAFSREGEVAERPGAVKRPSSTPPAARSTGVPSPPGAGTRWSCSTRPTAPRASGSVPATASSPSTSTARAAPSSSTATAP